MKKVSELTRLKTRNISAQKFLSTPYNPKYNKLKGFSKWELIIRKTLLFSKKFITLQLDFRKSCKSFCFLIVKNCATTSKLEKSYLFCEKKD